jgi:GNAT superfamily N-acetyltransferase
MNITIAQLQQEDQDEIEKLFDSVITKNFKDYGFYEKYKKDIEYEVSKQKTLLNDFLTDENKSTVFLIARDNEHIIGTIAYGRPSSDIKNFYKINLKDIPEVKSAYILPEYQGKGVGTMLLNEIIKILKQNGFNEFCLDSGYPKAQQFWEKKLGVPAVRIKNRWNAGNDYLIWHHIIKN